MSIRQQNGLARLAVSAPGPLRRGRAAVQARAGHPREGAGPRPPRCRHRLNNLAVLYRDQGRYAEAEPLYKRALAIREKALGPDHPDVGTSAQQPGRAVSEPGPLRRGRAAVQARPGDREKALGPDHPDVGHSLNNLAELYRDQGRYAEAEPLYKRALAIREKALGPDHPDVGTASTTWPCCTSQGRYAEAEPLYKRALRHPREGAGPRPPRCRPRRSTTWPCCTTTRAATPRPSRCTSARCDPREGAGPRPPRCRPLASTTWPCCISDQGRYAEAEPLYKRALAIPRRRWVPTTPMSATRLNNLAVLYATRAATPRPSRCTSARSPSREGAGTPALSREVAALRVRPPHQLARRELCSGCRSVGHEMAMLVARSFPAVGGESADEIYDEPHGCVGVDLAQLDGGFSAMIDTRKTAAASSIRHLSDAPPLSPSMFDQQGVDGIHGGDDGVELFRRAIPSRPVPELQLSAWACRCWLWCLPPGRFSSASARHARTRCAYCGANS